MFQKAACAVGRATKSLLRVPHGRGPGQIITSGCGARPLSSQTLVVVAAMHVFFTLARRFFSSFLLKSPLLLGGADSVQTQPFWTPATHSQKGFWVRKVFFAKKKQKTTYITYMVYMLRKESKAPGNKNMLSEGFSMMEQLCFLFERHRW